MVDRPSFVTRDSPSVPSVWDKESSDLRSHVVSSKARETRARASEHTDTSQPIPSLLSRLSRMSRLIKGSASEPNAERVEGAAYTSAEPTTKRKYGFATSKLALQTDQGSENLFRYRNFSSALVRSSSPVREENQEGAASGSASSTTSKKQENDDDDKKKTKAAAKK